MKRLTTEEFVEKAKKIHGNKYDYSKVEYKRCNEKIEIICKKLNHESFKQIPNAHLFGQGCPKCAKNRAADINRQTLEEFIQKSMKIHGDKYDYSEVNYINSYKFKVKIKCIYHNLFFYQMPKDHMQGNGCPLCGKERRKKIDSYPFDLFLLRAEKIHGKNKYNYNKDGFINTYSMIKIECIEHGFFIQRVSSHLSGNGCPICATIISNNKRRKTNKKFIKDAIKTHGNKYNYSQVEYHNNYTDIEILCPKHGMFLQKPIVHLQGAGCPHCVLKSEGVVKGLLFKYFPEWEIIPGKKIWNKYKSYNHRRYCDFWLERDGIKVIVEYDGEHHFKPIQFNGVSLKKAKENLKKSQLKDKLDFDFCRENGIILYRIKYDEDKEQSIKRIFDIISKKKLIA